MTGFPLIHLQGKWETILLLTTITSFAQEKHPAGRLTRTIRTGMVVSWKAPRMRLLQGKNLDKHRCL